MDKEKKNLLIFGYGLAGILSFFYIRFYYTHGWGVKTIIFLLGAICILSITIFNFSLLKIIYTKWMKVAHRIGIVFTGLILSLLFFLVFSPVGILFRLIRKDLLDRQIDLKKNSYWIKRPQEEFDSERYTQQF